MDHSPTALFKQCTLKRFDEVKYNIEACKEGTKYCKLLFVEKLTECHIFQH